MEYEDDSYAYDDEGDYYYDPELEREQRMQELEALAAELLSQQDRHASLPGVGLRQS